MRFNNCVEVEVCINDEWTTLVVNYQQYAGDKDWGDSESFEFDVYEVLENGETKELDSYEPEVEDEILKAIKEDSTSTNDYDIFDLE
jgi:hypothetical protein